MEALRGSGADQRVVRGSDRGSPCRRAGFATGRLVAILALLGLAFLLARTGTLVRVDSADMAPGLLEGDLVHVYTRAYAAREPARGEVAAFRLAVDGSRRFAPDRMPGLPTGAFLGRIVGLPGDVVESNRNALRINGERLRQVRMPHSYRDPGGKPLHFHELILGKRRVLVARDPVRPEPELSPTRVEPDRYLILGDHRTRAHDGRFWGTLERSALLGRATLVLFSRSPHSGEVRWGRIGELVE